MDGGRIDYTLGFTADTAAIKAAADEMIRNKATWDGAPAPVEKLDGAQKKLTQTTGALGVKTEELKRALAMVSTGSAEAGLAANFLAGRLFGLVGAGMYLIAQTKAGIESLMNSIATPVWEGFVGIVQKQRRAFQDAAQAAGLFDRELTKTAAAQNSRSEAAGGLQRVLQARLSAEETVAEKRKQAEIAWVNAGVFRAEERARKISEIERRFEEAKLKREQAAAVQAAAVARLKEEYDTNDLAGLQEMRGGLLANRERLGSKETLDAKEAEARKRLAQEEEASRARQERIAVLEAKYGIKSGEALPWWSYGDTAAAELTQARQAESAGAGVRGGLRREISQMERDNPAKRRAISDNEQNLGWVEADIRTLSGSTIAARRARKIDEAVALQGLNASAAGGRYTAQSRLLGLTSPMPGERGSAYTDPGTGKAILDSAKFSDLIYKEMVRLNTNLEKPFTRK